MFEINICLVGVLKWGKKKWTLKVFFLKKHSDLPQALMFFINDYLEYVNLKILFLLMVL